MSDDYLWDRSGEPDPEIARLERTLGQLRHQPEPLVLPVARPRHAFFPALAAAAVVLIVLSGGLWLSLRRSINEETNSPRLLLARPVPYLLAGMTQPAPSSSRIISNAATVGPTASQASRSGTPRPVIKERQAAAASIVARQGPVRRDQQVMQEGERATEQLML
ncbi:MAG: hypothetical protein H0W99_16740, partial [Acidobacteria bacterium]|nr:hypothetical protein [Acidobacteriota bacterium]